MKLICLPNPEPRQPVIHFWALLVYPFLQFPVIGIIHHSSSIFFWWTYFWDSTTLLHPPSPPRIVLHCMVLPVVDPFLLMALYVVSSLGYCKVAMALSEAELLFSMGNILVYLSFCWKFCIFYVVTEDKLWLNKAFKWLIFCLFLCCRVLYLIAVRTVTYLSPLCYWAISCERDLCNLMGMPRDAYLFITLCRFWSSPSHAHTTTTW